MRTASLLRLAAASAIAAAVVTPAVSAEAQTMRYRFTGNIVSGSVPANVFGAGTPATSLAGRTFTVDLLGAPTVTWNNATGNGFQKSSSDDLAGVVTISGLGAVPALDALFGLVLNNRPNNDARVTLQYMNINLFQMTHDNGSAASALRDYGLLTDVGPVTATSVAVQTPSGVALSNVTFQATAVPEPSTYALMATGLVALAGVARRRKQAR